MGAKPSELYVTAADAAALKQLAKGESVAQFARDVVLTAVDRILSGKRFDLVDPLCRQPRPRPRVKLFFDSTEHHLWCRAARHLECTPQRLAYSAIKRELSNASGSSSRKGLAAADSQTAARARAS